MKPVLYRCVTIALPLAFAVLACGQVTGLSDDYQFDLVDGGPSKADGAGDATKVDSPVGDSALDVRPANACTPQATAAALAKMSGGTADCKVCLASLCCADVETCASAAECQKVFSCKLDCTDQGDQRAQCLSRCSNGGPGAQAYASGVGQCGGHSCKTECGFP